MKKVVVINISEIEKLFKEYCKEDNIEYSRNAFKKFLRFLEIDFYDWVRENLKQFDKNM